MDAKIIGEHIKEYRKSNNVSQRALAEQLFVSDKTISRWELGKGLPDIEQLPKIAEILGISIDELVGAENEAEADESVSLADQYKKELERLEREYAEKERQAVIAAAQKKSKTKKIAMIVSSICFAVLLCVGLVLSLYKPSYMLTFVGVTTSEGTSIKLKQGKELPAFTADGKTVLGFIDENYNYYGVEDFRMPDHDLTLRALIEEEMPLFAASDGDAVGNRVAEHVRTEEGIPATKYLFQANSKKQTSIQSRPVSDSGEMSDINVYMPSLGERFFLLNIQNLGDKDVNIRYRVENFADKQGGLDLCTPTISVKANSITYAPVYFNNNSSYGVFNGCDHFVILDQDIDADVELIIFGYIYTAEELSAIEIVEAPDKFNYQEGEDIDLSGMRVEAVLKHGSVTGRVKLSKYDCDVEGLTWTEGMDTLTVSFAGKTDSVLFYNPYRYKIAFTSAANIRRIDNGGETSPITAAYTTTAQGMPATKFTIGAGSTANTEMEAWIHQEVNEAMANGQNLRIPTFLGEVRELELIVTNNGGQEISFRYYAENGGDKGGVDVTVAAGETKMVTFEVLPGNSVGCNYVFKLLNDVEEETSLTMHGYFYCRDELEGINIYKEAEKKSFRVGETFDRKGLVIKALGTNDKENYKKNYEEVVISNFETDLDGHTFTEQDIGVKTVWVYFDEFYIDYEIEVVR